MGQGYGPYLPPGGGPLTYQEAAARIIPAGRAYLGRIDAAASADLVTASVLAIPARLSRDNNVTGTDLAILVAAAESLLAVGLLDLVPGDIEAPPGHREPLAGDDEVARLINERPKARRHGDFAKADVIRERLQRSGIELRDTATGTRWQALQLPGQTLCRWPRGRMLEFGEDPAGLVLEGPRADEQPRGDTWLDSRLRPAAQLGML